MKKAYMNKVFITIAISSVAALPQLASAYNVVVNNYSQQSISLGGSWVASKSIIQSGSTNKVVPLNFYSNFSKVPLFVYSYKKNVKNTNEMHKFFQCVLNFESCSYQGNDGPHGTGSINCRELYVSANGTNKPVQNPNDFPCGTVNISLPQNWSNPNVWTFYNTHPLLQPTIFILPPKS